MVGGFLGVVNETGTLDVGIASIVQEVQGPRKDVDFGLDAFVLPLVDQLMVWVKKPWLSIHFLYQL